jgi:hypothetical protein
VATLAALILAGCGSPAPASSALDTSLQAELVSEPPAGYSASASGTGSLDLTTASYSTPADVSQTASVLTGQRFKGGYVRVWRKGPDYITVAVYRFDSASHAAAFAFFEKTAIAGELGSYTYVLSSPPWGTGFVITSTNKTRSKHIFCQGGLFGLEAEAFLVQTCGEQPNSSAMADSLAAEEYLHASGVVFPAGAPTPSPTVPVATATPR